MTGRRKTWQQLFLNLKNAENFYLVINQLEPGEEPTVGDVPAVVESCPAASDGLEHVCRDGRVMNVAADLTAADILEQRQREGVPHRVEVHVRARLCQRF